MKRLPMIRLESRWRAIKVVFRTGCRLDFVDMKEANKKIYTIRRPGFIIAVSEGLKAETVRGIYIRDCRIVRICIYMQGIIQSGIRILTVMIRKRMSLRY